MKSKIMYVAFSVLLLAIALGQNVSIADTVSIKDLWKKAVHSDPVLTALTKEGEASQIGAKRANRHWYPKLFATAKIFSTDDPGNNLMFTLQQRRIGVLDFSPATLNQPGSHWYGQGSLGVDLPLFEGGMKVALAAAAEKGSEAKQWELTATKVQRYASLVQHYSDILALKHERSQLLDLKNNVTVILSRYSIGAKSNPVGYSGLLGLKNLRNRIEGLLAQNEAFTKTKKANVESMVGELSANWEPTERQSLDVLHEAFESKHSSVTRSSQLAPVLAARSAAESISHLRAAERARFLPKIGAFAQGDLYGGNRDHATSYVAGAYLQWELFSAQNYGAMGQAQATAEAAEAKADALSIQMDKDRNAAQATANASEASIKLLNDSASLLEEQTNTAHQLFRNGSISALQLAELMNRRADLLGDRRNIEFVLAQSMAAIYMTSQNAVGEQE